MDREKMGGYREFRKEKNIIRSNSGWVLAGLLLLAALLFPAVTSRYLVYIATLMLINIICAQGLNILTGYAGQLSLGHGAFMAISAYLTAILCNNCHLSFWLVLVVAPSFREPSVSWWPFPHRGSKACTWPDGDPRARTWSSPSAS